MGHTNRTSFGIAGKLLASGLALALAASCLLMGFASADEGGPDAIETPAPDSVPVPECARPDEGDPDADEDHAAEAVLGDADDAAAAVLEDADDAAEDVLGEDPDAESATADEHLPAPVEDTALGDGEQSDPADPPLLPDDGSADIAPRDVGDTFIYEGIRYSIMAAASGSRLGKVKAGNGSTSCVVQLPVDGVVTIPEGGVVTRLYNGVRYYYDVTRIANSSFKGVSGLKQINLPSTLESIYIAPFEGTSLTSIAIPANVDYIDVQAFTGASMLASIHVDPGNQAFASEDGVLYTKGFAKLYRWPENKTGTTAVIREEVKTLEDRAFANTGITTFMQMGCVHALGGTAANVFAGIDRANATVWVDTSGANDGCTLEQIKQRWKNWGFVNVKSFPTWKTDDNSGFDSVRPTPKPQAPGSKLEEPSAPERTGYTFQGWYKDSACTTAWDFENDVMPEHDLVLYAKWKPIWYVVRFNLDGGNGTAPPEIGVFYDTRFNLYPTKGVRGDGTPWEMWKTGYACDGWRTVTNAQAAAGVSGTIYGETQQVEKLTTVSEVVNLYPIWTPVVYNISYNANGGAGTPPPLQTNAVYDKEFYLWEPIDSQNRWGIAKTGYAFACWNTRADGGGTNFPVGRKVKNVADKAGTVALWAKWTPISYNVSYNANGGSGTPPPLQTGAVYDQSFRLYGPSDALNRWGIAKTGYTFRSWNTRADGTGTDYPIDRDVSNLAQNQGSTAALWAQWAPNRYKVRFDANGATSGTVPAVIDAVYDASVTMPSSAGLQKAGYSFTGWNTRADGTGASYAAGAVVGQANLTAVASGTAVLYAQWTPVISVTAPLATAVGIDAAGSTVQSASVAFSSASVVPVNVTTAVCAPVEGARGTARTFPKPSQWPSIVLSLETPSGSSARFALGSAETTLAGFTVPAGGELLVSFRLSFSAPVDIAYVPAHERGPFARITYTFEIDR